MRHARTLIVGTTLLAAVLSISCNRGGSSAAAAGGGRGGRGGAPPAVALLTLQEKPIEQISEFIATLSSLRTTTIQPEVEGVVTRIFVKPGDRVRVGTPLVQINADKQQAAVRSTEASQTGTEADVQYLAPAGQATRVARRGRRHQPPGVRPGTELAAHSRGSPQRAPGAGSRGAGRAPGTTA